MGGDVSLAGGTLRIVRLANYVGPRSGGMRTALRELGAGYLAAGRDPVLVVPGPRSSDELTEQGGRLERAARRRSLPVRFTGFVTDPAALAALLASADVVLAPGPVETFGLAALEALACGTPVVVSADSALPEVAGSAGIAVGGEDFADGVRQVLDRAPAERRATARARAREFGWRDSVAAILTVHRDLAGPAGAEDHASNPAQPSRNPLVLSRAGKA